MKKIKAIILNEYLNDVIHVFGKHGSVQFLDINDVLGEWKYVVSNTDTESLNKCADLIKRIDHCIDSVGIKYSDKQKVKPRNIDKKSSRERLADIEKDIAEIEDKIKPISDKIEKIREEKSILLASRSTLEYLKDMNIEIEWLRESDILYVVSGIVKADELKVLDESLHDIAGNYYAMLSGREQINNKVPVVLVVLKDYKNNVDHILDIVKFEKFIVTEDSYTTRKAIENTISKLKNIEYQEQELKSKISEMSKTHSERLLSLRYAVSVEKNINEILSLLGKSAKVYALEGWVPEKNVSALIKDINDVSKGHVLINLENPISEDDVPTAFDNPEFARPFESITKSFGLPRYNEIDPTFFLAFTFPTIFGMMFGDVGEGLVIATIAYIMYKYLGTKNSAFINFGKILFSCGIASIIFGFIYGSVFGIETLLPAIWKSPLNAVKSGMMKELIGFALFVGIIHMTMGLLINSVNNIYKKGITGIIGSFGKLLLFFGVVTIIVKIFNFPIPLFSILGKHSITLIALLGLFLPILLIVLEEIIHEIRHKLYVKNILSALGNALFESADTTIMFLSNTLSYSRILILVLVHAIISEVIYIISELLMEIPYVGVFVHFLFILIGTILLIFGLEALVVYIQTIRLHYYEWFTKFYSSGGSEYKPFKLE